MRACQFFLLHLFFQSFQLRAILTQIVAVYSSQLFLSYRACGSLLHSHSLIVPLPKKGQRSHGWLWCIFPLLFAKCLLLSGFCATSTARKTSKKKPAKMCIFPTNITSFVVHGTTLSYGGDVQINWVFTLLYWLPSMIPLSSFLKSSV